jgi:hypothetical protein
MREDVLPTYFRKAFLPESNSSVALFSTTPEAQ